MTAETGTSRHTENSAGVSPLVDSNDGVTSKNQQGKARSWAGRFFIVAIVIGVGASAPYLLPATQTTQPGSFPTHAIERGELIVQVTEQGTLESSNNTEIKCRVRGDNTITRVIDSGSVVEADDVILQLDTLLIEEEIAERTKFFHLAKSEVARSQADVIRAELAISEYLEGRFVSELKALQTELAIAESRVLTAKNSLSHTRMLAKSEYRSQLEVEEKEFAVSQADLQAKLIKTRIETLENYTKREQIATLTGTLNAAKANHKANVERAFADEQRLKRAQEELQYCEIRAERAGMVIYPDSQAWKDAPDIEEGATVHKDQTLLLMPDLSQMQVKVGIHESVVHRVRQGLPARVTVGDRVLEGTVAYVNPVAKPAGWWTGNVVKYDAIVELTSADGLKPGMSVEVEVVLAEINDAVLVPTSAVLETNQDFACWVHGTNGPERRELEIGDSNDLFMEVQSGLEPGEDVILDPLANVPEAQEEAARSIETTPANSSSTESL